LSAATVYRKTAKGNAEINAKGGGLDRKLRPLLILVDGHRGSDVIISLAAGIGIEAGALKQLEADGYIEPLRTRGEPVVAANRGPATTSAGAPPRTLEPAPSRTNINRLRDGTQYMNETVTEALGVRALFFVLKIERCSSTLELIQLLPDFEKAVAKKRGPQYAAQCRLIAAEIVSE
jgi:hypothetical protein